MTYAPHWLLAWGGPLGTSGEQWQNSIRLKAPDGLTWGQEYSDPQEALVDMVDDIRTLMTNVYSTYSSASVCNWAKLNPINEFGRYDDSSNTNAVYLNDAEKIVPSPSPTWPSFVALCITFTTARGRGAASKGRLFVPQPAVTINAATGKFNVTGTNIPDAWTAFLSNLNNVPGADPANSPNAAIVSNVGNPGPWEAITDVKIGNVPDIQSRRKNALVENYITASSGVVI